MFTFPTAPPVAAAPPVSAAGATSATATGQPYATYGGRVPSSATQTTTPRTSK